MKLLVVIIQTLHSTLTFNEFVDQITDSVPVFMQYMTLRKQLIILDDIDWWIVVVEQLHVDSFCAGPCRIDGDGEYLSLLALTVYTRRDRINAIYGPIL